MLPDTLNIEKDVNIAFIIKYKNGLFAAKLANAHASEGDDDSFLDIIASGPKLNKVDDAISFLEENAPAGSKVFKKPIEASGLVWLSVLEKNEE